MRMFMPHAYVSVDFQNRVLASTARDRKEMFPVCREILSEESVLRSRRSLMEEIKHFVTCIRDGKEPLVSGVAEGAPGHRNGDHPIT